MSTPSSYDDSLKAVQLRKLQIELEQLERKPSWYEGLQRFLPLVTAIVAVAGFAWGIERFAREQSAQQKQMAADLQKHADNLREQRAERDWKSEQEFRQRFWEERLTIYRDVTKLAGTLASATDPMAIQNARSEFWKFYWGEVVSP